MDSERHHVQEKDEWSLRRQGDLSVGHGVRGRSDEPPQGEEDRTREGRAPCRQGRWREWLDRTIRHFSFV